MTKGAFHTDFSGAIRSFFDACLRPAAFAGYSVSAPQAVIINTDETISIMHTNRHSFFFMLLLPHFNGLLDAAILTLPFIAFSEESIAQLSLAVTNRFYTKEHDSTIKTLFPNKKRRAIAHRRKKYTMYLLFCSQYPVSFTSTFSLSTLSKAQRTA